MTKRIPRLSNEADYPTKQHLALAQAFLSLTTEKDMISFLRDLLTLAEIDEFARRLQIAKLLTENKSYLAIAKQTATSTTTVTRVAKWLFSGRGGYQVVLRNA